MQNVLDRVVEMSNPKVSRCIGLHVGLDSITAVETEVSAGAIKISKLVKVPLQYAPSSETGPRSAAMNVDFFATTDNWLKPFHEATGRGKVSWDTSNVVVTLPPQFSVFRHFIMPEIQKKFWKQSIPIEAKKYLPFPFEESYYDFSPYRMFVSPEDKGRLGVLFAITNKKISSSLKEFRDESFDVLAVEPSSVSICRLFRMIDGSKDGGKVYVHFGAASAHLLVCNNGVPLFFREVNFSDPQSTERRRLDLRNTLDFTSKQVGASIFNEVMLSGENLEVWKPAVEEDAKLPVRVWDPKAALQINEIDWSGFAAAGACARYADSSAYWVDLSGNSREGVDLKKANFVAYFFSGILVLVFLVMGLFSQYKLSKANTVLRKIKAKSETVAEFKGLAPSAIEAKTTMLRDEVQLLDALKGSDQSRSVTKKLEAVANTLPEEAWLINLIYASPVRNGTGDQEGTFLSMRGGIRNQDREKDMTALEVFREAFKKEPAIAEVYGTSLARVDLTNRREDGNNNNTLFELSAFSGAAVSRQMQ